ncbi:MAG: SAM-dependent methyltransferase [Bacteroidia bacterium]|nr:SAM-dependent methyltransferase [Bacteroidia bacterium]
MFFLPGSFRDPNGGVFSDQNKIYRWISPRHEPHYRHLMDSGLYDKLVNKGWLIPHQEVKNEGFGLPPDYRVIEPEKISFISYPYEWSFGQYRDTAILTLKIQRLAMEHGMSLRDASAFNIQFHNGRVVFIDTTSFEILQPGRPWVAYGQFCRHFLAPLALMACDLRLGTMMQQYADGIPLDLAYRLLPLRMKIKSGLSIHLFFHGRSGNGKNAAPPQNSLAFSPAAFQGLINSLENTLKKLTVKRQVSTWENYYKSMIISDDYLLKKKEIITQWIKNIHPVYTWDLGANDATFSRIAAEYGLTVALDSDSLAVEWGYQKVCSENISNLLPLRMDLANPSPGLGWANEERTAWLNRPLPQLTLALALVHHLVIGNNLPLAELARFFSRISPQLIIEFIPKSDPKIREMLAFREDIFPEYHPAGFEEIFSVYFTIEEKQTIPHSERILYLMQRKTGME